MQRPDVFAALLAVLGLGAGAYLSTFPAQFIRGCGVLLMATAAFGLLLWFAWDHRKPAIASYFLMAGAIFAALSILSVIGWLVLRMSVGVPAADTTPAKPEQELTIQLLWRTDFTVGSYKMLQMLSTDLYKRDGQRLGRFDFGVGMYGSFDSKSVFMSLYVPGSAHGHDLISWFADGYRIYLDDARKNFHIWTAPQGHHSQPISDNLIFTNRIYIYYENILPDDRVNELTNLYRSKGLEPVFRGFGYLEHKRLRIVAGQEKMPADIPMASSGPINPLALPPIDDSRQYIDGHELPSLLSLFMTDFKGIGAVATAWTDIPHTDSSKERKERVQFRVYADTR